MVFTFEQAIGFIVQSVNYVLGSFSANCVRSLKLCTDLLKGLNYRKMQGAQKISLGKTQGGHAHLRPQALYYHKSISASEGRRDFGMGLKEPQGAHLY